VAAVELLGKKLTLTKLREEVYELNGIKVMATYHPAALLRNPNWKRGCWEDVKKFRKLYDSLIGKKNV
jgi:DNA polymerase